ncbi:PHP domain-containing protein [Deinococcus sp.]|uniref:PHP domain-containing protein n=1 Tax=Deinococcus sp. TaxID=47478 RepID=UPI003B5BFDEB
MATLPVLLTCQSYFSEGRSTVSPSRLIRLAAERGFTCVGLVDHLSVSGAVELSQAARESKITAVIGTTLPILFPACGKAPPEVFPLVLLARNRAGYVVLCELITEIRLGELDALPLEALHDRTTHLSGLTGGRHGLPSTLLSRREVPLLYQRLKALRQHFPGDLYLQLTHDAAPEDKRRLSGLRGLARDLELPVVATPEIRSIRYWTP